MTQPPQGGNRSPADPSTRPDTDPAGRSPLPSWPPGEPATAATPATPSAGPSSAAGPMTPGQPTPGQPMPGQPMPGYATPGQPLSGQATPGQPPSGHATPGQPPSGHATPGQPTPEQSGWPDVTVAEPPLAGKPARPRRRLIIASIVLGVLVLLCGGGGVAAYLLLRNSEPGAGAPDPATAVDGLLTAVYNDQDAKRAADLVCSEARDQAKIAKKVDEVKGYAQTYRTPRFRWEPPKVEQETAERARVSVTVTMTTLDEKTAQQPLAFTVLKKDSGWRVCEVTG